MKTESDEHRIALQGAGKDVAEAYGIALERAAEAQARLARMKLVLQRLVAANWDHMYFDGDDIFEVTGANSLAQLNVKVSDIPSSTELQDALHAVAATKEMASRIYEQANSEQRKGLRPLPF